MSNFNRWLDTFLEEKGLDLDAPFEIEGEDGNVHIFSYGVVVEAIKKTTAREQASIKTMLVKIDFVNGKVENYFQHLAKALTQ